MYTFYWQLLALVLAVLLVLVYVLFFLFYFKQINDWLVGWID